MKYFPVKKYILSFHLVTPLWMAILLVALANPMVAIDGRPRYYLGHWPELNCFGWPSLIALLNIAGVLRETSCLGLFTTAASILWVVMNIIIYSYMQGF